MKKVIKKIVPGFLLSWYHFLLAFFGAVMYGFPSKKMKVIGVTGTKGKTTVCSLIAQILNLAGHKAGMATTVIFRIGEKEWPNATKQTMLGRFKLQKLLAQMLKQKCEYAVIETSSEGILQHRHRFIDYNTAVFTNLSPEHIERHGSFENYRNAKIKLFQKVSTGIYNLDDENAGHFLKSPVKNKYGYTLKNSSRNLAKEIQISNIQLFADKTIFQVNNIVMESQLIGGFNVYNLGCAVCTALSENISLETIQKILLKVKPCPGRMEVINQGQNFFAVVDYSYEPFGLENALKAIKLFNPSRIIAVFGSAAGGRDKWRRPAMGQVADKYADIIIVTTDDPYDEDPDSIIQDIVKGIKQKQPIKITDRRKAIKKAISMARENDAVLFAGKGGELWMNVKNNKKIPWNEAEIVKEELWKNMKS